MRRLRLLAPLVTFLVAGTSSPSFADGCTTTFAGTTAAEVAEVKIPVLSVALKTLRAVSGIGLPGSPRGDVAISLVDDKVIDLHLRCDCRPPCDPGDFQYARVGFKGTTTAFDGTVTWEEAEASCEARDPALENVDAQAVRVAISRNRGTARWLAFHASVSLLPFVTFEERTASMGFEEQDACECRKSCPEGVTAVPKVRVQPTSLDIVAGGEAAQLVITATDADGDLVANCVGYAGRSRAGDLSVTPWHAGSAGSQTTVVFAVSCGETEMKSGVLGFGIWDADDNEALVDIPVTVWHGRPEIQLLGSGVSYGGISLTHFTMADEDLLRCDEREVVTWRVIDAQGGTVEYGGPGNAALGVQRVCRTLRDEPGEYVVGFRPDAPSGQFTIEAVDAGGFAAQQTVRVDKHAPVANPYLFEDTDIALGLTDRVTGNVLANDMDPDARSTAGLRVPATTGGRHSADLCASGRLDGKNVVDLVGSTLGMAPFTWTQWNGGLP